MVVLGKMWRDYRLNSGVGVVQDFAQVGLYLNGVLSAGRRPAPDFRAVRVGRDFRSPAARPAQKREPFDGKPATNGALER